MATAASSSAAPPETTRRTEKVYVLFGSQTGNSEQWAKELCAQVSERLSPSAIQTITGTNHVITVKPIHMQLDDFLELEKCTWTRLIVIITSSYGVGQAPLGCYRFRDLCDTWYDEHNNQKKKQNNTNSGAADKQESVAGGVLDGVFFALCGLGDSKYTTYFQNPARINEALHLVGAKRVGPLGQADASGTGDESQGKVVEEWIHGIWPHLAKVVAQPPLSTQRLQEMQLATVKVCQRINPDFDYDDGQGKQSYSAMMMQTYSVALAVAVLAILFYFYSTEFQPLKS
ncbi:hypothetical protein ACA910_016767 [Epithemia clementina (nom. ined.)]